MDRDFEKDPVERHTTYVESSTDSGVTWFIVGALVIAAGVLAYMYFGDDGATTAETPAIEGPADTGRAATPDPVPAPAPADPAPVDSTPAAPPPPAPAQ